MREVVSKNDTIEKAVRNNIIAVMEKKNKNLFYRGLARISNE